MAIYKRLFVLWIFMYSCLSTEGIIYLGCYQDNDRWNRVLMDKMTTSDSNSPEECARNCSDYRYAGVESWEDCYCGNTMNNPQKGPESECNYPCPGDDKKLCGGDWMISVYTNWVTACGPPPTIANGNATLRKGTNLTYGSIADVNCDQGFIGKPTITCLYNTPWETATCDQPVGELGTTRWKQMYVSTTDGQSAASKQQASKAVGVGIGIGLAVGLLCAVGAVVSLIFLRRKKVLPCLNTAATSNIGTQTFENGPEL